MPVVDPGRRKEENDHKQDGQARASPNLSSEEYLFYSEKERGEIFALLILVNVIKDNERRERE